MRNIIFYVLNHKMFCLNKQTKQFLKPINETVKLARYITSEKKKNK